MHISPGRHADTTGPVDHLINPQEADTKATDVYRALRAAVRSGDLEPGEKLRLESLKKIYETSLSPCREALARLVGEGFVVAEGKKGFRVRGISRDDFISIHQLRDELETSTLTKSINNRNMDWESRLVARYYRLSKFQNISANDIERFESRESEHRAFHLELLSECQSSWHLRFYDQLAAHVERYRRILLPGMMDRESSIFKEIDDEHKQLMELSIAGDIDNSIKLLANHRERTYQQILKIL